MCYNIRGDEKMYQNKKIHYKAIFKQDGDTESVEYKANGVLHHGEKTCLSFQTPENTIDISYGNQEICLKNGHSLLNLHLNKEIWNQYQLPYGSVMLRTKVLLFETNDERIKLKYELYDQQSLISTVYIFITMVPLVEEV